MKAVLFFVAEALLFLEIAVRGARIQNPAARRFLPLPGSYALKQDGRGTSSNSNSNVVLRVLQFNVLADGLSGLRPDLGGFNRVTGEVLRWDRRKEQLIHEISQYAPDIVTLQEVDHYYDFFLPEMTRRGYTGFFARKPTSACLDYTCADGCAMFVKKSRLRVISCEAKTLALSIAGQDENGELIEDDASIQMQNQVGLIALCEVADWRPPRYVSSLPPSPPLATQLPPWGSDMAAGD